LYIQWNVNNFVHSMFTFFKECTQFCLSNVHKFSKIIYKFVYSMHLIFQSMYKTFYIQHTQFFKKCTKLYRFNIHIFEWKYKIVYIQLIQIFEEYNQFCTFKHTHTHTHTTQLSLSLWIWVKEHQTMKIKSTVLHNKIDSTKPNNHILIYSQFFKYNNEIRSLIIHTKAL